VFRPLPWPQKLLVPKLTFNAFYCLNVLNRATQQWIWRVKRNWLLYTWQQSRDIADLWKPWSNSVVYCNVISLFVVIILLS
jgi:hypothetical protein